MSFYADHVLPHLINMAMRNRELLVYRKRVIPAAEGRVLEIGIGSGLNLPFYQRAREVLGLDPSPRLAAMAEAAKLRRGAAPSPCELSRAPPNSFRSMRRVSTRS